MFVIIKKYQNLQEKNVKNPLPMWVNCVSACNNAKNSCRRTKTNVKCFDVMDILKKFQNTGGFRLLSFKRAYGVNVSVDRSQQEFKDDSEMDGFIRECHYLGLLMSFF